MRKYRVTASDFQYEALPQAVRNCRTFVSDNRDGFGSNTTTRALFSRGSADRNDSHEEDKEQVTAAGSGDFASGGVARHCEAQWKHASVMLMRSEVVTGIAMDRMCAVLRLIAQGDTTWVY